ncbi:hypothetical protein [Lysobacter gummosus]|uniref:hypothetical protein n=1 Tax=Lysobacter gummosus TaxID=262324 RepID=UPI0036333AC2
MPALRSDHRASAGLHAMIRAVNSSILCLSLYTVVKQTRHSRVRGLRFTSAEPNIQRLQTFSHERPWIPAFAGMTT